MKLKELNKKEVIKLLEENCTHEELYQFGWILTNEQRANLVLIFQIFNL